MGLDKLENGISGAIGKLQGILGTPIGAAAGGAVAGGAVVGAAAAGVSAFRSRRKKKAKRKTLRSSKRKGRRNKHRISASGKLKYHRHRHGKHHSKGIHYTKNGQPYIILASGKARFVSKRGAKASKKRKGGRY